MQASPIRLLNLLGDSKVIFKIPVYQRNYEWNREQLEQYFFDIEKIVKNDYKKDHFLGTIVFVNREIENLMQERILIDGQQRITTTILLLKAIVDLVAESSDKFITKEEIYETYLINKHAKEKSRLKLKPVEADMYAYQELMINNETDSKIYENYLILKKLLEESDYTLEEIYRAMAHLNVVYISLDKDENPQIIFESLNSTGLSLTQADLIRNFILMGLDYENQTRLYKDYWIKIERFLPNSVISDFVRDFLTMKESSVPNKNKVYVEFKSYYFENNLDSEEVLIELVRYAEYYHFILNESTGIYEIDEQIHSINNIKSTVTYPYLLGLFNDYYYYQILTKEDVSEILKIIVSYIYRRSICNIPTNRLNKVFSIMPRETMIRRDEGMGYIDSVLDFLMSRKGSEIFPRDDEFKSQFISSDIYNKSHNMARLILYNIEKARHKEVVKFNDLSVEHIMPQRLTPEWNLELGNKAYETYRIYKDTIGNLTLTNYNSEISNRSFEDKKKYYLDSNIKTTREVANYESWNEDSIIDRSLKLFDMIKEIWELPKDNYQNIADERLLSNFEYSILDDIIVTGYTPKSIIFDGEEYKANTWKEMLVNTCQYLYSLDRELFISLMNKSRFKNLISEDSSDLGEPRMIVKGLHVATAYNAKDMLSYIVLLTEEFGISQYVYFKVK